MVGSGLPRVTGSAGLTQDEQHAEKRCPPTKGTPQYLARQQQQVKYYSQGGDPGKRNVPRGNKGADHRVGGAPDMTGRINFQSSTCSSNQSLPQSNLERFLDETTPRVRTDTLKKSDQKRSYDSEPFFYLKDLWDSFDEWSAYGAGVHLDLNDGNEGVVQYYVPYLSAIQLYTVPSRQQDRSAGYRSRGSDSDTGSDDDGEYEKSLLECKTYMNDNDEEVKVWSYFEKSPPYTRLPLVDKIADLSRDFEPKKNPLKTLRSIDLLPKSWLSVAWYPIYRIPTGPTLRDLAACFLTFYPIGDGSLRQSNHDNGCVLPARCSLDPQPLKAFGLASYKLKGNVWSRNGSEKRRATSLQHSADEHLKHLRVEHPDYNYFVSHTISTRY